MKKIIFLVTFLVSLSSFSQEVGFFEKYRRSPWLEATVGLGIGVGVAQMTDQNLVTTAVAGVALGAAGYYIYDYYDEKYGEKELDIMRRKEKIIQEMMFSMEGDLPKDFPVEVRKVFVPGTRRSDGSIEEGGFEYYLDGSKDQGQYLRGN